MIVIFHISYIFTWVAIIFHVYCFIFVTKRWYDRVDDILCNDVSFIVHNF